MNNYLGIGVDAKAALDFHHIREQYPSWFRGQVSSPAFTVQDMGVVTVVSLSRLRYLTCCTCLDRGILPCTLQFLLCAIKSLIRYLAPSADHQQAVVHWPGSAGDRAALGCTAVSAVAGMSARNDHLHVQQAARACICLTAAAAAEQASLP